MEMIEPTTRLAARVVRTVRFVPLVLAGAFAVGAQADEAEEVARQLTNPVAALISVPFQNNFDRDIGPARDGSRWLLNVQPVVPFDVNDDWNVISRTIVPIVRQDDIFPGAGRQSGLGDIVQSVFFSPKAPTAGGLVWGVGPVFLLPTGTDDLLTTDKWGAGPTGVVLRQDGPWTAGVLANHIWSFAGSSRRADVNATFVQPFLTYTLPTATTFVLNTETTYDWENRQWSVPLIAGVTQVLRLGGQLVQLGVLGRYWAESPQLGPHGWGLRVNVTLLFPR